MGREVYLVGGFYDEIKNGFLVQCFKDYYDRREDDKDSFDFKGCLGSTRNLLLQKDIPTKVIPELTVRRNFR